MVVSLACLMIMISTTLSCWDAFTRTMTQSTLLYAKGITTKFFHFYLALIGVGSLFIIHFFLTNMKTLVDFATTVAFVVGPLIASLSLFLVLHDKSKDEIFPRQLKIFSVVSTLFLSFASAYYVLFL